MKKVLVLFLVIGCCYCLENNELLLEETRAKKKKGSSKLLGMILLFIFSKLAIFKAASVFFMMAFFQKLFYLFGVFLNYFLKSKGSKSTPSPVYGAPAEYNTIGYSYGPPEHELNSKESGLNELGGAFDWLIHRNVK
ncbi:uncharacterized protein [Battus philenor]|uniref:uncharacterized protein n=1 Tax=Battus philenor TaxID=42288 RepID=UPI0035CE9B93